MHLVCLINLEWHLRSVTPSTKPMSGSGANEESFFLSIIRTRQSKLCKTLNLNLETTRFYVALQATGLSTRRACNSLGAFVYIYRLWWAILHTSETFCSTICGTKHVCDKQLSDGGYWWRSLVIPTPLIDLLLKYSLFCHQRLLQSIFLKEHKSSDFFLCLFITEMIIQQEIFIMKE